MFTPAMPDTRTAAKLDILGKFADAGFITRTVEQDKVPTVIEARTRARNFIDTAVGMNVTAYTTPVMLGNDDIAVMRFNRNGSTKVLWNYTKGCKGRGN